MKKINKIALSMALALLLVATTVLPLVACAKKGYDNENFSLVFSSQELDGVFNPFFSTTGADGNVVSPTQVSMLGNNKEGSWTYGDNEQVVTKDLEFYYDTQTKTTTYYFVLKNNIKFSNGSPLTIKDVLFNYYVYLDPAYTGSSTIYSTDIVGLKAYRTQQQTEEEQDKFKEQFQTEANTRVLDLVYAAQDIYSDSGKVGISEEEFISELNAYKQEHGTAEHTYENLVSDFKKAGELFKEELESDYTNAMDSYKDKKFKNDNGELKEGLFTTDVEMFLFNEGYIKWDKKANNGNGELTCSLTTLSAVKSWTREKAIGEVYNDKMPDSVDEVITGWATAGTLYEYLVNNQMEEYFKTHEKQVPNIEGIKFANRKGSVNVNGTDYAVPQYEADGSLKADSYEVLSIEINKEDPKAIWNFAIAVAPMYYYSTTKWNGKNYIQAFDYEENFGVEYGSQDFMTEVVKANIGVPVGAGPYAASRSAGGIDNVSSGEFYDKGIVYYERNPYYFAGPAKIKSIHYKVVAESQMINSLYQGDIHFIEPNAKPENKKEISDKESEGYGVKSIDTSGYGYIGINAGKVPSIKVRQAIMHAIDTQECVNYYKSTAEPIYRSMSKSNWAYPDGCTPYYPYIGGEIPENLEVVNPDYKEFVEYKRDQVAGTSEANKYDAGKKFSESDQYEFLLGLIQRNGYEKVSDAWTAADNAGYINNGVLQNNAGTDRLNYEFTIAGEETDHPAYSALLHASELLNSIGFDVTVRTDANALSKLSSGALTVWAAAWGSTIDPDMYQVYHMDSQATSVLNWGYKQILGNTSKYATEYGIVTELSALIEKGRETSDQKTRKGIYRQALDLVMELAVELPTYQRKDLYAYNTKVIDVSTFTPDNQLSSYKGLISDLNKLSLMEK